MRPHKLIFILTMILCLPSCALENGLLATVGPDYHDPKAKSKIPQWYAPLPAHEGKVTALHDWWAGFGDPVLKRLLSAAQEVSSSIAEAKANIAESRSNLVSTHSLFLPGIDASLSANRSSFSFGQAPFIRNQFALGVQSSWEIDLFGGLARQREAAVSQLQAKEAAWHDARVAVAAELANAYLGYRFCQVQLVILQQDFESRQHSEKMIAIASEAGFRSPAEVALARASMDDSQKSLLVKQAECDLSVKSLVALTALSEPQVRSLLASGQYNGPVLPKPAYFLVDNVPANAIRQRPDIASAERDLAEASANIGVEQANRFPKLSLSGNITPIFQNVNGAALTLAETWSIGPTINLPIFDAGKRIANVDAAKAKFDALQTVYHSKVRMAIKEVEDALVNLHSAIERLPVAQASSSHHQINFQAMQKLFDVGLGNLMDVENARRDYLTAQLSLQQVEQDKVAAWLALYRAVGGGWQSQEIPVAQVNQIANTH